MDKKPKKPKKLKPPENGHDVDWKMLEDNGWQISILIDNLKPNSGVKESYVGKIISTTENFVLLETIFNTKIQAIFVRKDMVLSIWVYRYKVGA